MLVGLEVEGQAGWSKRGLASFPDWCHSFVGGCHCSFAQLDISKKAPQGQDYGINWDQMSQSEGHSMLMSRLPYFAAGLVKPEMYLAICFSLQSIRQIDKLYTMLVTSSASSRCFAYELRVIGNHTLCLLLPL